MKIWGLLSLGKKRKRAAIGVRYVVVVERMMQKILAMSVRNSQIKSYCVWSPNYRHFGFSLSVVPSEPHHHSSHHSIDSLQHIYISYTYDTTTLSLLFFSTTLRVHRTHVRYDNHGMNVHEWGRMNNNTPKTREWTHVMVRYKAATPYDDYNTNQHHWKRQHLAI